MNVGFFGVESEEINGGSPNHKTYFILWSVSQGDTISLIHCRIIKGRWLEVRRGSLIQTILFYLHQGKVGMRVMMRALGRRVVRAKI